MAQPDQPPEQAHTPQHIFVSLRRTDTSQPWGFRMKGGAQMGMPLFVEQVAPHGKAAKGGMVPGDLIVVICGTNVARFSHDMAKSEILRAGNELEFTLQRGTPSGRSPLEALHHIQAGGHVSESSPETPVYRPSPGYHQGGAIRPAGGSPARTLTPVRTDSPGMHHAAPPEERVQVVEEHICRLGGPVYKDVQPKTYKILEQQLPPEETPGPGRGPASIFDRKKQERSQYLKANSNTIQKAYGEG